MNVSYRASIGLLTVVLIGSPAVTQSAFAAKGFDKLDELSTERWGLLRETEKYQLQIAEKYYRAGNYPVAAGEYEKFITLYETSEGAPYAQFMWSHCQVKTKKLNTAVKDGYQTVIDYWPDSPEAVASAYLIGQTYKDMGEIAQAKAAYQKVLEKYADEMVAILTRLDLAELARIEQDRPLRIQILKDLVTTAPRAGDAGRRVASASETLASLQFDDGAFAEGLATLATTFKEPELSRQAASKLYTPISQQVAVDETRDRGLKMADAAIAHFNSLRSAAPNDDAERAVAKNYSYWIAGIHSAAKRTKEAGEVYESLTKEFPGDDDVLTNYAGYLKGQNRRDEARLVYGRMKNQIEAKNQIAWSYREEQKYLLAVPIYQELITADAAKAGSWQYQLGQSYHSAGKYQEAIAAYRQSDLMPSNLNQIADCQRAMKQYREAISTYTQVAAAFQNDAPGALLQIARTYEQAGESESAIKTYQQVCRRFPKSSQASTAHQDLNNKYKITVTLGGAKDE